MIELQLPYPPAGTTGNHAVKHGKNGSYLTEAATRYRQAVAYAVALAGARRRFEGPLAVEWVLSPPDSRARDTDNVRKSLADALTKAGLWADDSNRVIRREVFDWTEPVQGGSVLLRIFALTDEKVAV